MKMCRQNHNHCAINLLLKRGKNMISKKCLTHYGLLILLKIYLESLAEKYRNTQILHSGGTHQRWAISRRAWLPLACSRRQRCSGRSSGARHAAARTSWSRSSPWARPPLNTYRYIQVTYVHCSDAYNQSIDTIKYGAYPTYLMLDSARSTAMGPPLSKSNKNIYTRTTGRIFFANLVFTRGFEDPNSIGFNF